MQPIDGKTYLYNKVVFYLSHSRSILLECVLGCQNNDYIVIIKLHPESNGSETYYNLDYYLDGKMNHYYKKIFKDSDQALKFYSEFVDELEEWGDKYFKALANQSIDLDDMLSNERFMKDTENEFPKTGNFGYITYVKNSSRWLVVGALTNRGSKSYVSTSDLNNFITKSKIQPGDIFITDSHICMYVGTSIPKSVYKKSIKGKGILKGDRGTPISGTKFVSAHLSNNNVSKRAALCMQNVANSGVINCKPGKQITVVRCVKPKCK